MNSIEKLVIKMGLLSLLTVMPLAAQIGNGVTFTAPFPFYAGDVKLPAGSYRLTQPYINAKLVRVQNIASTDGAFIIFTPTSSLDPQRESDVTFDKYGDTGYLRTLSLASETDGMEFGRSKAETKAAAMAENTNVATVVEHATLLRGE
jgi:hypothetical protein